MDKQPTTAIVSAQVPAALRDELIRRASAEDISLSRLIREALAAQVKEREGQ